MNPSEIVLAQKLINSLSIGEKKCLSEIYDTQWSVIINPTDFGKKFKEAVLSGNLTGIRHIGIRSTGRCDEYEKI